MPLCSICGDEVGNVVKCKECGERYCEGCGDLDKRLCYFCDEEDDYEESFEYDEKDLDYSRYTFSRT
jgi:hypothetical protein